MKHGLGVLLALLICLSFAACAEKYVGKDIAEKDITDFCYTFDVPLEVSEYQRYRFWLEDGKKLFFHETRRGGSWPLTEEYTVKSGTVALTDEEWAAFLSCLQDGMADAPDPEPVDGDSGPWMQLYWTGDEGRYREFSFASREKRAAFEYLCARLAGDHILTGFVFSVGGYTLPETHEVLLINGIWYHSDLEGTRPFDPALAKELQEIIEQCGLAAWNGFHESDPDVLDGEWFMLLLNYADGTQVYASGENAFPAGYHDAAGRIRAIFVKEAMALIAGSYRYEKEGLGGDFVITLKADGTYTFYEGYLSSYIGAGTWSTYFGDVYLKEENGLDLHFLFRAEDGALIYLEAGSDAFIYVKVADQERFVRTDEGE